jgi:phosphoribosylanthranilate isomerase
MKPEVKICGLSTPATMQAALDAGADYIGLVFFDKSPRFVGLDLAAALADQASGRANVVALLVDPSNDLVDQLMPFIAPDFLQLQGAETPARVAEIKRRTGARIIKAIKVETAADAATALDYRETADLIMFDAKAPKDAVLPGGNGVAFDWRTLDDVKTKVPYILAGGLKPDNVAAAIRGTGTTRVDVSSGVETSPGQKDADLIRAFIAKAAH